MQIEVVFRNLTPSDPLKSYCNKRFQKLSRTADNDGEAKLLLTLSMESGTPRVDARLTSVALDFSASERNDDMYAAVDLCCDRLSQQVRKSLERRSQIDRQTVSDVLGDKA